MRGANRLLSLFAVGSCFVSGARANLILNDSFEMPGFIGTHLVVPAGSSTITSWTVATNGRNVVVHKSPDAGNAVNPTFNFAHSGDYYLDLSGDGPPHATLFQDFATVPLQVYELAFWIGASDQAPTAATINAQIVGAAVIPLVDVNLTPTAPGTNINWTHHSYTFLADSTTTRLNFRGLSGSDDNASYVDDCTVLAIPEPAIGVTAMAGAALLRRRRTTRP